MRVLFRNCIFTWNERSNCTKNDLIIKTKILNYINFSENLYVIEFWAKIWDNLVPSAYKIDTTYK